MTVPYILLIVLGALLLFVVAPTFLIAIRVHQVLLKRERPEKWSRACTFPEIPGAQEMFDRGLVWARANAHRMREVSVVSEGLRLCGEFYDFGFDKTAILLPGRAESLTFCYFFAPPYPDLGYNVLVVDPRAHGHSEGKYSCAGTREYRDLLRWTVYAHTDLHSRKVLYHGICIGSATSLYALTSPEVPDYVEGMVAEGMFTSFPEIYRTHMIAQHRPVYPVLWEGMWLLHLRAGVSPYKLCPEKRIGTLCRPILMLCGREDIYSLPDKSQRLYDLCQADKTIVWFDHGDHSHLRLADPEKYDGAVAAFVRSHFAD